MEFDKNNFEEEDSLQFKLDLRDQINKYLPYWKWFVLSLIICVLFALINLNYTVPQYKSSSTIQIRNTEGREKETQLSAFKELGIDTRANNMVEDEIEVLKSKSLITKTIKELNLNIQFFTDENPVTNYIDDLLGLNINFFNKEVYKEPYININFLASKDSIYQIESEFIITLKSATEYFFNDLKIDSEKKHTFGEKIKTSAGEIIVTPNFYISNTPTGSNILVKITPLKAVIEEKLIAFSITQLSEFSSILNLTFVGSSKEKSEDFINTLVKLYNEEAVEYKNERAEANAEFVKTRLEKISAELSDVDMTAEQFKQRNRLSDMASETEFKPSKW